MTLFELGILFATTGIAGVGCAAVCSAVLDRIGREMVPQSAAGQQPQPRR